MRKVRCGHCGCERILMLKGVHLADQDAGVEFGLASTCIPCLLRAVKATARKEDEHLWAITGVPHAK